MSTAARWRKPAAIALAAGGASFLASGAVLDRLSGPLMASTPLVGMVTVGLLLVGTVLATRRSANPVGWLVLLTGFAWAALVFTEAYARYGIAVNPGALPGTTVALWFATWLWIPGLVLLPVFVLLLFPDGRLPSTRWRPVLWAATTGLALSLPAQWTIRWGEDAYHYDFALHAVNPVHVPALEPLRLATAIVGAVLLLLALGGAVAASIVRFRGSRGQTRQQMKWVVFGAVSSLGLYVLVVTFVVAYDVLVGTPLPYRLEDFAIALALAAFPASIAVAVLKYGLYEIDRIVSRAVTYVLVTAVVVGVYGAVVLVLAQVVGRGSDLAVAGATLAAAALFRPVRRRVQALVDRRFNRARYDAQRTVAAFSARLRDEVDIHQLSRDLVGAVHTALQPTHAAVWLREAGR